MEERNPAPEQLISGMSTPELVELLEELGIEADESQAGVIQQLVVQLGSLEGAIEALELLGRIDARRAA